MKTKSLLDWTVLLAFGAASLILLAVGAVSYRSIVASNRSDGWVRHTHEVLENLDQYLFAVTKIEWSIRGFILTGDESYLQTYRKNKASAAQHEATVRALTVDNPVQQRELPALEALTTQKTEFAELVSAMRRTQGLQAAADAIQSGRGQQITAQLQAIVQQMQAEEQRLLANRDMEAKRNLFLTKAILTVGTLLGLLITAAAGWTVLRGSDRRRRAEQAFRDSEEQYRMLLYDVQDYAVLTLDPLGQVVTWNAGAERIYGYSVVQIVGHNFSRFFPPGDIERGRSEEVLRITAASGRHEEQGVRVRKDGSEFLASVTCTALRGPTGNLRGYSEVSRDLSETEESGARYRGLMEAAPDAMVVVNQSGEIVLLNLQAEKQFGYLRDELLGQKVTNIIPEGFAERLIADGTRTAAEALAQQIGTGIELSARRKDGSAFPIELMLSPLEGAEGILVTAAIRDISVRKAAETHLAQMEGRYRGLMEAAPDAMVVVNQGGEIVLLNVQAEKQFGYRRDELLGQKVTNIIPEGFAERLVADGLRSAEDALEQQIGTGIELSARRKDGSEF